MNTVSTNLEMVLVERKVFDFMRWCVFREVYYYNLEKVENYSGLTDWAHASCSIISQMAARDNGIVDIPDNDTLVELCDDFLRAAWDARHTVSTLYQED